jgi:hypothetical protein
MRSVGRLIESNTYAKCDDMPGMRAMEEPDLGEGALLDLEDKSNEELRELLGDLNAEEQRLSYRRRVLHGKIDILRAELVRRLKSDREAGESVDAISGGDIDRLIKILANELKGVASVDVTEESTEE